MGGDVIGAIPSTAELDAFAAGARAAGRRLVVGALIVDGAGRIFVQRRSPQRALFPGAWDIVGGHAEPGEGVRAALAREVAEETGWRLARLGPVVEVFDWQANGERKREIDLLVGVEGDLARPRLERAKHPEARWLEAHQQGVLLEARDPDDTYIQRVVAAGFALLARAEGDPFR